MRRLASILLCTRNPRRDYFERVLDGLRSQTLSATAWQLLVVDNGSDAPLADQFDVSWHPAGCIIREDKPGKAAALACGIEQTKGELIVVVDDDNLLATDYLERAVEISENRPMLGCWSGQLVAEFEKNPEPWVRPYLRYLAIRDVTEDLWSNFSDPAHYSWLPWGAGMVIRRDIAVAWSNKTCAGDTYRAFERLGSGCGGEDIDMALTASDLGFGTGLFTSLKLTHLIRAERVQEPYLLRLMEGMTYSLHLMAEHRGQPFPTRSISSVLWGYLCALRKGAREFRLYRAARRGIRAAEKTARPQRTGPTPSGKALDAMETVSVKSVSK